MIPQKRALFCIIVHFGADSTTNRLLEDMTSQTTLPKEILVIDHAVTAYTPSVVSRIVRVVRPKKNGGYAAGINEGLQRLEYTRPNDLIVCCNNDIRLDSDVFEKILSWWPGQVSLLAGVKAGYVNLLSGRSHIANAFRSYVPHAFPYVHGSFLVASSATWQRLGRLPEQYFLYWEDAGISARASRLGINLGTLPMTGVSHDDSTSKHSVEKEYLLVRNGAHFLETETPGLWRLFWRGVNVIRVTYHMLEGKKPRVAQALKDRSKL